MHSRGRKVNQQYAIHDRARRTIPYTHKAHATMSSAIRTANGQLFDYAQPRTHHLSLQVLAQGLSRESRFAGQSADLYTVAQHSVLASHLVPVHLARQALYHDAAEALLKDLPKPLKVLLGDYQAVERQVERELFTWLGLPEHPDAAVKRVDRMLLMAEPRDLMPPPAADQRGEPTAQQFEPTQPWVDEPAPAGALPGRIRPWSSRWACLRFALRAVELERGRPAPVRLRLRLLAAIYMPRAVRPPWPHVPLGQPIPAHNTARFASGLAVEQRR